MFVDRIPTELKIGDVIDGEQLHYFEEKYGRLTITNSDGRGKHLKFEVIDARKVYCTMQDDRVSSTLPPVVKKDFYELKLVEE